MPIRKGKQITVLTTLALGVALAGGTSIYAEQPRGIRTTALSSNDGPRVRNSDLSGGFYEDSFKTDNWFYDFYDSPGAIQRNSRDTDMAYRDQTTPADAAHPRTTRNLNRNEQTTAFQQYYDEPWFYDQRDPLYGMPETRTERMASGTSATNGHFITGTVTAIKQVRNRTSGDQNTVTLLKAADGREVITDLGPTQRTLDMAITKGDQLQVAGQWEDIGNYSVLMAQQVKSGANRVNLHREAGPALTDNRQVEGRIQQFRDIRTNRTAELHRTAAVQTADGRIAIVDLGQDTTERTVAHASPGDRIVANGRVVQVGNYPVLLANQVAINDGAPVQITRLKDSTEVSPGTDVRKPDCLGGGCANESLNRDQPRDPHTNAMDGTIR
jgi:hypothetical protein